MLTTYFVFKKVRGSKFIAFMTMLPSLLPAAAYVGFVKYIISPQGGLGYFYATVFDEYIYIIPIFFVIVIFLFVYTCKLISNLFGYVCTDFLDIAIVL